jgi:cytosine/adenosine deaminase-related metal-dependent hydrolase
MPPTIGGEDDMADRGGNPITRRTALASAAMLAGCAGASSEPRVQRPPADAGAPGGRYVLRGGAVFSMDRDVGDVARADVLVEGGRIAAVGRDLDADDAATVDCAGCIVMPGFVDTHHHSFETPLRAILADGLLSDGERNYFGEIIQRYSPLFTPEDARLSVYASAVSQLDAGVTTVVDISQIHHTPEHVDACVAGFAAAGQRVVMAYNPPSPDAMLGELRRLRAGAFASRDQLLTLALHTGIAVEDARARWAEVRDLGVPIVSHMVGGAFGPADGIAMLARAGLAGPDIEYIHCTNISDDSWRAIAETGGHVSIACPIEMTMRHGMPPIQAALDHGVEPSLSSDVECTMTADPFTQMRSILTLQRAFINERAILGETSLQALLTCRDVVRMATFQGARTAHLDDRIGAIAPGKEADLVVLRADSLNVAPLNNVPGAIVTLMDRTNVDSVIVAGRFRKFRGALVDVDVARLVADLERTRDGLFARAGQTLDVFA